ncbi:MAG: hypothetical protein JXR26_10400 [Balneolaceae bacterium]|nr:hypothetical protein [Balneolaceae bacterium]
MNLFKQRAFKILMGTFVVYGILVATHKGEFWPFSIYPMFSQAGNPWTRAIVRDVTHTPDSLVWETTDLEHIQGSKVALKKVGVDQIDFSNFISKTEQWDTNRKNALIRMFGPKNLGNSRWVISKVRGRLTAHDSVIVEVVPFLLVKRDTVLTNPLLPKNSYVILP